VAGTPWDQAPPQPPRCSALRRASRRANKSRGRPRAVKARSPPRSRAAPLARPGPPVRPEFLSRKRLSPASKASIRYGRRLPPVPAGLVGVAAAAVQLDHGRERVFPKNPPGREIRRFAHLGGHARRCGGDEHSPLGPLSVKAICPRRPNSAKKPVRRAAGQEPPAPPGLPLKSYAYAWRPPPLDPFNWPEW